MAKYYCILFDADNTLLNFDAAENKALAETLVNFGIEPDAETVQTYRTINEELWRQLEKGQIKREKLMAERSVYHFSGLGAMPRICEDNETFTAAVAAPVLCEGDVLGAVLFVTDTGRLPGDTECKLAQTVAAFLGKSMES